MKKELNQEYQEKKALKTKSEQQHKALQVLSQEHAEQTRQRDFLSDKLDLLQKQLSNELANHVESRAIKHNLQLVKNYHDEELRMYKRENRMLKDKLNNINQPEKLSQSQETSFMRKAAYATMPVADMTDERQPRARSIETVSSMMPANPHVTMTKRATSLE